jgi:hypothetical protein
VAAVTTAAEAAAVWAASATPKPPRSRSRLRARQAFFFCVRLLGPVFFDAGRFAWKTRSPITDRMTKQVEMGHKYSAKRTEPIDRIGAASRIVRYLPSVPSSSTAALSSSSSASLCSSPSTLSTANLPFSACGLGGAKASNGFGGGSLPQLSWLLPPLQVMTTDCHLGAAASNCFGGGAAASGAGFASSMVPHGRHTRRIGGEGQSACWRRAGQAAFTPWCVHFLHSKLAMVSSARSIERSNPIPVCQYNATSRTLKMTGAAPRCSVPTLPKSSHCTGCVCSCVPRACRGRCCV